MPTMNAYEQLAQKVIQECGTKPPVGELYNTSYHFNYLNIGLLVAVIFLAAVLIKKNKETLTRTLDVLKRYRLSITLGLLAAALMISLFNPIEPWRMIWFGEDLRDSFYQTGSVPSAYLDYLNCKENTERITERIIPLKKSLLP